MSNPKPGAAPVRPPKVKAKAKRPAGGTSSHRLPDGEAGRYNWGDGKGRVHTIPLATHKQNEQAKAMLGGTLDLTAPPSGVQAVREAQSAADLQYGPQVTAARQLQANIAPWFQDYLARVAGYAQSAQALSAPVLQQAQAYQQGAAAQTPPGLDPNSPAFAQAQQAAQGRQALGQLGLDALNSNAQATQDYFGGQQNVAARVQPQLQAQAGQQVANAESQRGQAVQGFLTTARQNAQNYAIARGTLKLNDTKAQADAEQATTTATERHRHNVVSEKNTAASTKAATQRAKDKAAAEGAKPNKYGIPQSQWEHWSTSHRQRVIDAFNEKHAKGTSDKDKAKHITDVHTASGKIENTITDIIGKWNGYVGKTTDDTTKPVPDASGKKPGTTGYKPTYAPRKVGPDDIRALLAKDYTPQMIHIALLRRVGKPLDQASIDYLHNLDPNIRIPRAWLAKPHTGGTGNPASAEGTGLG